MLLFMKKKAEIEIEKGIISDVHTRRLRAFSLTEYRGR